MLVKDLQDMQFITPVKFMLQADKI